MAYQPEIEKLKQRYEADPSRNFAQLAEAHRREGRLDEALEILRLHLEERPNYVSGLIVLGRCLLDQHSDLEARETFQQVLAVDAEHIIALKSLADIAERGGDVAGAREWLQRLLDVDPMNDEAQDALDRLASGVTADGAAPEPSVSGAEPEEGAPPGHVATVVEMVAVTPESVSPPPEESAAPRQDLPAKPGPPPDELVIERASAEYQGIPADLEPVVVEQTAEAELPPVPQADEAGEEVADERRPVALDEEPTVEMVPPEDGLLRGEEALAAGGEAEEAAPAGLEMQAFDTDLGWGTGERISRQISQEDLEEAAKAHDDALDSVAAQELPGLESVEVPDLGVEIEPAEGVELAQVDAPTEPVEAVEGLTASLDPSEATTMPLPGLEPTGLDADVEPSPLVEPVEELPTIPVGGETVFEQPAVAEPGQAAPDEPSAPFLEEALLEPPPAEPEAAATTPAELEPAEAAGAEEGGPETIGVEEAAIGAAVPEPAEAAGLDAGAEEGDDSLSGLPVFLPGEGATDESGAPIVTETMAEVYAKQGLLAEAREIYQKLVASRPDDTRLRARLAELEGAAAPASAASAVPRGGYDAAVTGGESARAMLKRILAQSPGGGGATASLPQAPPPAPAPRPREPETPMDEAFGPDDADEPEGAGSGSGGESSAGGPSGAPTQPASSEVSLASVFGDAPPPKPSPPPSNRGPANRDSTGGFSFDEFFEPKADRPSAKSRAPRDSLADDEGDEAFQDWLKGLKG